MLGILGTYGRAIGSEKRGNVRYWKGRDGSLEVAIDVPDTAGGYEFMKLHEAVPHRLRPVVDEARSTLVRRGSTNHYQRAHVKAFSIAPTDADEGWPDIDLIDESAAEVAKKKPLTTAEKIKALSKIGQRAKIWLL